MADCPNCHLPLEDHMIGEREECRQEYGERMAPDLEVLREEP